MKKIINKPENYVDEMLEGLYAAHPDYITYTADDLRCLVTSNKVAGKVGIVTGGGSGHLPLFLGYVGKGMLDGCCVGGVFQSPSPEQVFNVTKEVDDGAGVLYIYGNYNGDILNFDMGAEMADFEEDIRVETVVAGEDVASAAPAGVALTPCTIPEVGKPGFTIADDEMAIGMGIHGEAGIRNGKIEPADAIVDEMLEKILPDIPYVKGDEVAVMVNGLGATPLDEQYIVTRHIDKRLKEEGIKVHRYYVGEFATAMEMAGFSISLFKLDDELKELLDAPAATPFFKQL